MKNHFGRVAAMLRKDLRDEEDQICSQERLGAASGLGVEIIGKIEQGKHIPDPDRVRKLARALSLTTWEYRELALLAMDAHSPIAALAPASQPILQKQLDVLAQIQMPAFLHDDRGDLIAANEAILRLTGLTPAAFQINDRWTYARFNGMRVIFDPAFGYEQLLGESWRAAALAQMQLFRRLSLKHRGEVYMEGILRELRSLPRFRALWQEASLTKDWQGNGCIDYAHHSHAAQQMLHYLGAPMIHATPYGELVLAAFVPLDATTAQIFTVWAATSDVVMFTQWPTLETEELSIAKPETG